MALDPLSAALVGGVLLAALAALFFLRRREHARGRVAEAALAQAREEGADQPASLHPVIDTQVCIGSLSCVSACPEGDILGIVNGAATLVRGASCIGHGRCALECPVDAIQLVIGSETRGVELPEVGPGFESSRAGVHVVGELGGMGLIKNAITQGTQVGAYLAERLGPSAGDERLDAVVVGAGPAGIATGAALARAGRSFRILEQRELGGAIASYPRHKVVMSETVPIPGWGRFGRRRLSKEQLVEDLRGIVQHFALPIAEGVRVEGIEGEDGDFVVKTSGGDVQARKVVLAIGRRGTPRRLEVPGEDASKVTYALIDPEQYRGRRVLVVGGGDSAVEAAVALAEHAEAVTISYRKSTFSRCRAANRAKLDEAIALGRVRAAMSTEVARIGENEVVLTGAGGETRLENDFVIVNAGGVLPTGFLRAVRVGLKRHQGAEALSNPAARPRRSRGRLVSPSEESEATRGRRLGWLLAALGLAVVSALAVLGWDYYALPESLRRSSPMHEAWRPAGDVGHGIGIVASLVMLSNFLYPLRKRLGWFKGTAPIRRWLSFHVFVGLLSPAVIAFHAAFQSNNLIASGTFLSLLVVVGTGLLGRFVYGLVPRAGQRIVAREVLEEEVDRLRRETSARVDPDAFALPAPPSKRWPLLVRLLVLHPWGGLRTRARLRAARPLFSSRADYEGWADTVKALFQLGEQLELYESLRRFLGWWRVFHVTLALLLVVIMGAHIGVALYLGYGWILL